MPIDASFIALFRSESLACDTRYFGVSLVGRSRSSLSRAFFGLRQWIPFLTLTTCDTRQSETVGMSFSACSAEMPRTSLSSLIVCDLVCAHALFKSWSKHMLIQDLVVSMRGKSSGLPLMSSNVMLN